MHLNRTMKKAKTDAPPRRCHRCNGSGVAPCRVCGGTGKLMRGADANGRPMFGQCQGCFGRKMMRCQTCNGQLFL